LFNGKPQATVFRNLQPCGGAEQMESVTELDRVRRTMIERHLQPRGIHSSSVLAAMERVPRERFASSSSLAEAYADRALPIDCGQTISQPYMVAVMTECLELTGTQRVLEIGTGSGYQTAILAELAAHVYSLERHARLSQQADERLRELGYKNCTLRVGDGTLGWPEAAPFDRIMVTAASRECPRPLFEQLAEGGILTGPFGGGEYQVLQVTRKISGRPKSKDITGCRFVPLIGAEGEPD
jgi:protein-L-isoaspartate(D-aspartate) O-methyltransferase